MATEVTNYQCPACTGPLHYSGASGKLECEYCGNAYDVAEIEALYAEKEKEAREAFEKAQAEEDSQWDQASLNSDWGADGAKMRVYNCPSCGAELICDDTTAASSCPYCGNPTVVPGQFHGALRPDYIVPFKLDKEGAKAALKKLYKGKKFLPGAFTQTSKIEKIQGIYVPFWMFDGEATADMAYETTRSHTHVSGDYEVTNTEHFDVRRAGRVAFQKIPVDASKKLPDEHMDAIEPFDYSELKEFSSAYLPGYLADKYDVSVEESSPRADERACNTAADTMRKDVTGYDTCTEKSRKVNLKRGKVSYAMLPVYLLNIDWKGQKFLFAVNGQTGKTVGNLPISKAKYWAWFAGLTAALAVPFTLLAMLIF